MCLILSPSAAPAYDALLDSLRRAVRQRRTAEANYGRALARVNFELTSEQRSELYEKHRIAIGEAESAVAAAVVALVAAVEEAL